MEEVKRLKITDITYVHDAEAMQRWLDLYVGKGVDSVAYCALLPFIYRFPGAFHRNAKNSRLFCSS